MAFGGIKKSNDCCSILNIFDSKITNLVCMRFAQNHNVEMLTSHQWEVSVALFRAPVHVQDVVSNNSAAVEVRTYMEGNIIPGIDIWPTLEVQCKPWQKTSFINYLNGMKLHIIAQCISLMRLYINYSLINLYKISNLYSYLNGLCAIARYRLIHCA